jgi:N-acetylglucosamine-6-phosphate deacetylase
MLAFTARSLMTSTGQLERPLMLVEDGRIVEITSQPLLPVPDAVVAKDLGDVLVAPGYLDLHIHGGAGFDVMDDAGEALPSIERGLAQHGITGYYPTTVTAPIDATLRALERLADAIEGAAKTGSRARPLGIHLEGPFISHARKGMHPVEYLLSPSVEIFDRLWQAARGQVRMLTIAPELDGALELIAEAARRGVCVSLGHSDADFQTTLRGVTAGARHATHTFNAMRPLDHRSPGILGAVLTDERLSADMIVDGVHLDPATVKLVATAKGLERTVLISDATAATGMPDGHYHLGSTDIEVRDGKCMSGGTLAGSVLTLDSAVRNLMRFAGWSLNQAVGAASRNPARVAGLANKGELAPGADADFVVLNGSGDVLRTFVAGVECLV